MEEYKQSSEVPTKDPTHLLKNIQSFPLEAPAEIWQVEKSTKSAAVRKHPEHTRLTVAIVSLPELLL